MAATVRNLRAALRRKARFHTKRRMNRALAREIKRRLDQAPQQPLVKCQEDDRG
jgi:hypothetical protein